MHRHAAQAALEAQLDGLHQAHPFGRRGAEAVGHHLQDLAVTLDARGLHPGEAAGGQPLLLLRLGGVGRQHGGKGEHQARVTRLGGPFKQVLCDGLGCVVPHGQARDPVHQLRRTREEQLQVVVDFGHRAHGRAAGAHRVGLVDGDGRGHTVHTVDRGAVHAVEKLPRVG